MTSNASAVPDKASLFFVLNDTDTQLTTSTKDTSGSNRTVTHRNGSSSVDNVDQLDAAGDVHPADTLGTRHTLEQPDTLAMTTTAATSSTSTASVAPAKHLTTFMAFSSSSVVTAPAPVASTTGQAPPAFVNPFSSNYVPTPRHTSRTIAPLTLNSSTTISSTPSLHNSALATKPTSFHRVIPGVAAMPVASSVHISIPPVSSTMSQSVLTPLLPQPVLPPPLTAPVLLPVAPQVIRIIEQVEMQETPVAPKKSSWQPEIATPSRSTVTAPTRKRNSRQQQAKVTEKPAEHLVALSSTRVVSHRTLPPPVDPLPMTPTPRRTPVRKPPSKASEKSPVPPPSARNPKRKATAVKTLTAQSKRSRTSPAVAKARGESQHCHCNKVRQKDVFMIACDGCDRWFHGDCVSMTQTQSLRVDKYFCPGCQEEGNVIVWKPTCQMPICQKNPASGSKYCSQKCGLFVMKQIAESRIFTGNVDENAVHAPHSSSSRHPGSRQPPIDIPWPEGVDVSQLLTSTEFGNAESPLQLPLDPPLTDSAADAADFALLQDQYLIKETSLLEQMQHVEDQQAKLQNYIIMLRGHDKTRFSPSHPEFHDEMQHSSSVAASSSSSTQRRLKRNAAGVVETGVCGFPHDVDKNQPYDVPVSGSGETSSSQDGLPDFCQMQKGQCSLHAGWQQSWRDALELEKRTLAQAFIDSVREQSFVVRRMMRRRQRDHGEKQNVTDSHVAKNSEASMEKSFDQGCMEADAPPSQQ